jgi:hypothetical protein
MKTIEDLLNIIKEDQEIQELINKSEILKMEFKPRKRSITTKSGLAMKYLWGSIEGAILRNILSKKYGVDNSRGNIKDALLLYLVEFDAGE